MTYDYVEFESDCSCCELREATTVCDQCGALLCEVCATDGEDTEGDEFTMCPSCSFPF